jgi:hypothetical protein
MIACMRGHVYSFIHSISNVWFPALERIFGTSLSNLMMMMKKSADATFLSAEEDNEVPHKSIGVCRGSLERSRFR